LAFAPYILSQEPQTTFTGPPETLDDLKTMLSRVVSAFPGAMKDAFNDVKETFKSIFEWFKSWWEANYAVKFSSWIKSVWQRIKDLFYQRKAIFETELGKEENEMQKDMRKEIPGWRVKISEIWQKFRELIK
jgi:predicted methyltransferase